MFKRNRALAFLLAVLICLPTASVYASDPVKVFYSGSEIVYDVPPQVISNRTMVPLRITIEAITGQEMLWDANTRTVTFYANGHTNKHTIGQKIVYVDGVPIMFDTPSLIIENRTLVPVRMIAETSGCDVQWDAVKRYVIITPPAVLQPSIASVTASKTAVNPNESIVLTIKTNTAANFVWVDNGYTKTNAVLQSTEASAGVKTWTANVTPATSGNLSVYANGTQSATGAALKQIYITVSPVSPVSIISISANKTAITSGDNVTLTINTNSEALNVWAEYDNYSVNAAVVSIQTNGSKTWEAVISPASTQNIRIYANKSKTATGAAAEMFRITVSAVTVPVINSAVADSSSVTPGDSVGITVKTNTAANYAWIEYGSNRVEMTLISTSGGVKTWVVSAFVTSTTTFDVYAALSRWGTDASSSVKVTAEGNAANPSVTSVDVSPGTAPVGGSRSNTFTIKTNLAVDSVSLEYYKEAFNATLADTSGGTKTWTATRTMIWDNGMNANEGRFEVTVKGSTVITGQTDTATCYIYPE